MSVLYEDEYVPIVVNAPRERRRRSPIEVGGGNNIYLNPSVAGARPRAASTGATALPINLTVRAPSERSHSRHRSRDRHRSSSRSSSGSSRHSRNRRSSRRSRYDEDEYENLPYHVRKQLDEAREIREAEKEKDRLAQAKREKERWEADYKDREKEEKRRRERMLEEAREEEARKKREADELRKKIIEEEEEKKKKAKKKKEEEEKEFEEKVKQKFRAAGYSDERIERVLHDKRKNREDRDDDRAWAIDLSRPTFIKVNRKYLSPDTLDHYRLPWEWDRHDTEYIIIKKYIDEDFQDILFTHTKTLKEKKLITSGYEKDVKVTLRPVSSVVKENDKMYLVREKSKSPGRSTSRSRRSSWMFT